MRQSQIERNKYKGVYIPELCPKCQAKMLGNAAGEKWCSKCDHGITDYTINGRCVQVSEHKLSA